MNLHNLQPAKGSTKSSKRVGRGEGSGKGGTSTRGTKGAKARAGYSHKLGFEGGQMPLQRRIPKFGFKNPTRVEYCVVNLPAVQALAEQMGVSTINTEMLVDAGLVSKNSLVKVLGNGEITTKLEVTAHAFSKSAIEKIEKLGGTATIDK